MRRLAFSTHWATSVPMPNCFMIDGRARGTAVWSTNIIALATIMATRTTRWVPFSDFVIARRCAPILTQSLLNVRLGNRGVARPTWACG